MRKIALASLCFAFGVASAQPLVKPIPEVTPGATSPAVTQENIKTTICKVGYTKTVRPKVGYTNKLKLTQLAGPYKNEDMVPRHYEEDHLISLELGGSPDDPKNLWPEPYGTKTAPIEWNARKKDRLENTLKRAVCAGRITLDEAQKAISSDWIAAYGKYVKK